MILALARSGNIDLYNYFVHYGMNETTDTNLRRDAIIEASKSGSVEMVKKFKSTQAKVTLKICASCAVASNSLEVVKYFVEQAHVPVKSSDEKHTNMLSDAVTLPSTEVADYLLQRGATLTRPALLSAIRSENFVMLELLLQYMPIDAQVLLEMAQSENRNLSADIWKWILDHGGRAHLNTVLNPGNRWLNTVLEFSI